MLPPREPHRYGADGEPWTIYWAHFAGRMAADYAGLAGPTDGQPGVLAATGPAAVGIENLLHTLRRGYGRIELVGASTGLAAWFGIVHRLRAEARAAGENSATRLLAAAEWLRARLAERVTVEEMARVAGLSPSHFSTLFRARLGYSPLDFHLRLRVQRSCELLANSGVRVAEAGAAVGFADPLYFSRVFRRIMGEPPSAYAARQKFR